MSCAVLIRRYGLLLITLFFSSLASCVPLQAPSDGKIQNSDIKHGALVSFSCNDGFQMDGSIILKCIDGKWNGSAPTCKGLTTFCSSVVFNPLISLVCKFSFLLLLLLLLLFLLLLLLLLLLIFLLATSSSNNAHLFFLNCFSMDLFSF